MDYMEHGYRKATPLQFNMGGWIGQYDKELGLYDNADKVLKNSLLAQNICQVAYREPKTVTEIASDMGVAADYIEAELERIVPTQAMRKLGNRYQTLFLILDGTAVREIFDKNMELGMRESCEVIDLLYSCAERVAAADFYGCDWGMERLVLFLVGYLCVNAEHNTFETDKLPFYGDDKAWYVLATTERSFGDSQSQPIGINSAGSRFGLREYGFVSDALKDVRDMNTADQKAFYTVWLGQVPAQDEHLANLVESGKVVRCEDGYRVNVPVLSTKRGDEDRLRAALSVAFERINDMQARIYRRSMEMASRYIPDHIADQRKFFGGYFTHCVPEVALFRELCARGISMTDLMGVWYVMNDSKDAL